MGTNGESMKVNLSGEQAKRTAITEESGIHKGWYEEAKKMTPQTLPEFIRKLTQDYAHDYGTICHAIAAAGLAAMCAVDHSPEGGITGFQASCIIWEVIQGWGVFDKGPKRMLCYSELLYPQYAHKFTTISKETWKWVKEEAHKKLLEARRGQMHPDVSAHMESVAVGNVPFGLRVAEE